MSSQIDVTKPTTGTATTQSVRDNFTQSVSDIEALQGEVSIRSVAASVASNALTLALKTSAGIDATSSTGVEISFRNSTAATGTRTVISATSALSVVAPQGATLGFANSATDHLYVYAINNSSTVEVAVSASLLDEGSLHSTTAISATADSATVLYSTTARTNVSVRILGRVKITTGSTAGTWSAAPTEIHSNGNFHLIIGQDVQSYAISAATKVTADAALPKAGGTMTGDTLHGDNVKATYGAGADLEIFHDGARSIIRDSGTGNLLIRATDLSLQNADGATYASFVSGGAGTFNHNNSPKLATTSTGIDVTGVVTADGLTLGDNEKAKFGASDDLQIYHDGSNSIIYEGGTGDLQLRGNGGNTTIMNGGGTATLANFGNGSSVDLYHNNAKKLATTSTGVNVTGTVTADGLVVDGGIITSSSSIEIAPNGFGLGVSLKRGNGAANGLTLTSGGDISFYEDTGTTPKFFWDASAESLGIGTSSPAAPLDFVSNSATQAAIIRGRSSDNISTVSFKSNDNSAEYGYLQGRSNELRMFASSSQFLTLGAGAAERMRIDSSGNVGIGTSSPSKALDVTGSIKASGTFNPSNTDWGNAALIANGSYGGGIAIVDGSTGWGMWADTGGANLRIGQGATSGALSTKISINADGIVTKPYQPSFQAHGTGGHTTYSGVFHMNSTSTNTGGHYSTASSRFTAPVAGNYYFTCSLNIYGPNTAACAWYIRKNGTDIIRADQDGTHGGWKTQTISGVLTLGVNDYVDVYLNSNTYVASASWTHFSGHLIG